MDKAIAVQGRYTGFFAKACAILFDTTFVTLSFGVLLIVVELCILILKAKGDVSQTSMHQASEKAAEAKKEIWDSLAIVVLYGFYWFGYFFLGTVIMGQTPGMALVGIKVVHAHDGKPASVRRAFLRTALLPLSVYVLPILGVVGAFRRDGRMVHDLVAGTGLVYNWNARLTKMRERAMRRMERESFYDGDDGMSSTATEEYVEIDEEASSSGEHSPLVLKVDQQTQSLNESNNV